MSEKKIDVSLIGPEVGYILMLVMHDFKERSDQARHAIVHGIDYNDPVIDLATYLFDKLEAAKKA